MRYSSRFFLYAPLALFLALAAWVMVYWWIVAGALDSKLTALNGHEALPGVTLSWQTKTITGFPFNLDVAFTGVTVRGQAAHGPFSWTAEKLVLHRLTYGRDQDIYEAAGRQAFTWTDGAGAAHSADFLPGTLRASSITDGRGLARFDLDIVAAAGKDFSAADLQLHLRRDPDGKDLDLMARADTLSLKTANPLLGAHVARLNLYETVTAAAAFAGVLAGKARWPEAAKAWRGAALVTAADVQADRLTTTARDPRLAGLLSALY
jgi:hypothetical protein